MIGSDSPSIGIGQITEKRFDETVANHKELAGIKFTDLVTNDMFAILVTAYHIKDIQDRVMATPRNTDERPDVTIIWIAYGYNMGPQFAEEAAGGKPMYGNKSDHTGFYYASEIYGNYLEADKLLCHSEYWSCE